MNVCSVVLLLLCALATDPNELFVKQDWSNAATAYELLTREQPDVPKHWMRLGICRMNLKEYAPAIAAFDQAIAHKGNEAFARYQLACAHARLGHADESISNLSRAVELGSVWPNQLKTDEHLASIQSDARVVALIDKLEHPTRGIKGADALDHWVGEWDVYVNDQLAGHNHITKMLDGYAIEEHWQSNSGGRGQSFFIFLPDQGKWKQLWTSDRGWRVEKIGTPIENGIELEGTSTQPDGTSAKARERLTKNPDGTVRQLLEDFDEASASWKVVFDGLYKPRKS
jgi:tetratricopeptide (TPR) repeat protein